MRQNELVRFDGKDINVPAPPKATKTSVFESYTGFYALFIQAPRLVTIAKCILLYLALIKI